MHARVTPQLYVSQNGLNGPWPGQMLVSIRHPELPQICTLGQRKECLVTTHNWFTQHCRKMGVGMTTPVYLSPAHTPVVCRTECLHSGCGKFA